MKTTKTGTFIPAVILPDGTVIPSRWIPDEDEE